MKLQFFFKIFFIFSFSFFVYANESIDFKVKNRSIGNLEKVAKKLTPGGLGVYSGFIHIDTGPHRRWKT